MDVLLNATSLKIVTLSITFFHSQFIFFLTRLSFRSPLVILVEGTKKGNCTRKQHSGFVLLDSESIPCYSLVNNSTALAMLCFYMICGGRGLLVHSDLLESISASSFEGEGAYR